MCTHNLQVHVLVPVSVAINVIWICLLYHACHDAPLCLEANRGRYCPADEGWFLCDNGVCVTSAQRCDGVIHCGDGSDEFNCESAVVFTNTVSVHVWLVLNTWRKGYRGYLLENVFAIHVC